jgi:hypothetical protein
MYQKPLEPNEEKDTCEEKLRGFSVAGETQTLKALFLVKTA